MTPVIHTKTLLNRAHCGLPYPGTREHLGLGQLGDREDRDYGSG
jgi:hypothetical protein